MFKDTNEAYRSHPAHARAHKPELKLETKFLAAFNSVKGFVKDW